jgi:hypothetical protein
VTLRAHRERIAMVLQRATFGPLFLCLASCVALSALFFPVAVPSAPQEGAFAPCSSAHCFNMLGAELGQMTMTLEIAGAENGT